MLLDLPLTESESRLVREEAARRGIAAEEFARDTLVRTLRFVVEQDAGTVADAAADEVPDREFDAIVDYVLKKNAELYRRLA